MWLLFLCIEGVCNVLGFEIVVFLLLFAFGYAFFFVLNFLFSIYHLRVPWFGVYMVLYICDGSLMPSNAAEMGLNVLNYMLMSYIHSL